MLISHLVWLYFNDLNAHGLFVLRYFLTYLVVQGCSYDNFGNIDVLFCECLVLRCSTCDELVEN
jgi:hypothetical protein